MCRVDDADPWTMFRDGIRTARKEWRCGECGRTIRVGESYHFATGLLDGEWPQMRQCLHCHHAAEWLSVMCHGWIYGDVCSDLAEHWDELPRRGAGRRALARLTSGIKRRWLDGAAPVPTWAGDAGRAALEAQRERVQRGLWVV